MCKDWAGTCPARKAGARPRAALLQSCQPSLLRSLLALDRADVQQARGS